VLKVPAQFRAEAPPSTEPLPPPPPPSRNGRAKSRHFDRAVAGVVPFSIRLLLWVVAVPLGFIVVFGIASALGFLTSNQLEDVFLETGWDRFWPVGRLLPIIALLTASMVHFSVIAISRWRVRHASVQASPKRMAAAAAPSSARQPYDEPVG
jgi:hypothetical protein